MATDLIDENDSRKMDARDSKEGANELLALANPLGRQRRGADAENQEASLLSTGFWTNLDWFKPRREKCTKYVIFSREDVQQLSGQKERRRT